MKLMTKVTTTTIMTKMITTMMKVLIMLTVIVMMTAIIMARTYLDLPLAPPDHGEGVSSWHF